MTQADIADFATWTDPGTSFQIQYSLPLFHEIDMTVSEGYRRIPHGGIEVGGLLFGRQLPDGARIEAFRSIECEHAQGPSFKLSDRDVALLREQIASAPENPELGGMELLGWFVAHTRGPLQMTEAETRLFAELFPGAGKMTVLVKPEKFKPTLFTFLVRGRDGSMRSNGTDQAIILPLPGRAGRADVPAPEARGFVPAPAEHRPPAPPSPVLEPMRPVEPVWRAEPEPPAVANPEPVPRYASPEAAPPLAIPAAPPAPLQWDLERAPVERSLFGAYGEPIGRPVRHETVRGSSGAGRVVLGVVAAVILAAGAMFWYYQQMPAEVIQLSVEPQTNGIVVSWPPGQTSDAAHAFLRVNDGPLVELPLDAKVTGRYQLQAPADNLKVEIVSEHTLHNSRGIVRYLQPSTSP